MKGNSIFTRGWHTFHTDLFEGEEINMGVIYYRFHNDP